MTTTKDELRKAGWVTAEDLAKAGYDWTGTNESDSARDRIGQVIEDYKDLVIGRLAEALHLPESQVTPGRWERHSELGDMSATVMLEQLIDDRYEPTLVSPVAVELMELEGFIAKREKAAGKAWAVEGIKTESPTHRSIEPDSSEVREKKGRSRK